MRLKFKSTTLNPKALVYRRFIALEQSLTTNTLYKTTDNIIWAFNSDTLTFIPISAENVPLTANKIDITATTYLQYRDTYFWYDTEWKSTTSVASSGITLLSATFNNIAKYQLNRYYYVGSFDYMIKGSIEGSTTQYIKGNIIPFTSLNIKHFNDEINLSPDDLVVVDKHLYSVENVEESIKRQPKGFSIYFATLNSIL